jgi:hypothetical protein
MPIPTIAPRAPRQSDVPFSPAGHRPAKDGQSSRTHQYHFLPQCQRGGKNLTENSPVPGFDPLLPYIPPEVIAGFTPEQQHEWSDLKHRVRALRESLRDLAEEADKMACAAAQQGSANGQEDAVNFAMFLAIHADAMRALLRNDIELALEYSKSANKYI